MKQLRRERRCLFALAVAARCAACDPRIEERQLGSLWISLRRESCRDRSLPCRLPASGACFPYGSRLRRASPHRQPARVTASPRHRCRLRRLPRQPLLQQRSRRHPRPGVRARVLLPRRAAHSRSLVRPRPARAHHPIPPHGRAPACASLPAAACAIQDAAPSLSSARRSAAAAAAASTRTLTNPSPPPSSRCSACG